MRRVFAVSLVVLLCGACEEPVSGSFEIRNATGEAFTFRPTACADGGEYGYWGVQLRDGARFVDIFKRGDTPYASVYSPGQAAFEFQLDNCEVFEGSLNRRTINSAATIRGEFTLECVDAEGHEIFGSMDFQDCGEPDDPDDDDGDHHHHH